MIDRVDERLEKWAAAALGKEKVEVTFAFPPAVKRGVGLHLLEVLPAPPLRTPKRPPLQLTLRYLVTASAENPADAHRILGELAFAALENPDFDVEIEPLPPAVWTALGVPLRPAFVLRVPLRRERPEPPVRRVRMPLVIRNAPMRPFTGLVVGPGGIPIVGARVEAPSLGQAAETDVRGRFRFPGVPVGMDLRALRVFAKGLEVDVKLDRPAPADAPLVIRMDALEE